MEKTFYDKSKRNTWVLNQHCKNSIKGILHKDREDISTKKPKESIYLTEQSNQRKTQKEPALEK